MKLKASELRGATLDWAVAEATDEVVHHEYVDAAQRKMLISKWQDYSRDSDFNQQEEWSPSTNWGQGGPLIERLEMEVAKEYEWRALCRTDGDYWKEETGETPLIAACRAIVAAKLGDEVDVPEALV